ncbi:MAG: molybdopterin biosynthesis protein [Bacillota bacterium]
MKYGYLTNIPLEEAVAAYGKRLHEAGMRPATERIPVPEACGRMTARAVYANICSPHYNACAMDGIALKASVTFGATETTPVKLAASDFVRVDTGDPLPPECDAVVMIEDVVETDAGDVLLYAAATPWQHVRQIGEDISAGDMIVPSLTEITPAAAGAMLAGGVTDADVIRRPVVGIIPTGDEVVPPTQNPGPGDVMEFNSTIFSGALHGWGAIPRTYPIVKDKLESIIEALRTAIEECDAVILNAGSSAGREDFSAEAIGTVGEAVLHGIAIRPGKPAILGIADGKPVIGVPGYPVSGVVVLEYLIKPVIDALCARETVPYQMAEAVITRRLNSSLKYREFVRARIGKVDGRLVAIPLNRGAGMVTSLVRADGIIDIAQDCEGYEAGESAPVRLLRPVSEIERALCVVGSHDPLIDEVADLMRIGRPDLSAASAHVGSMGGIMAIKRGEAHAAGIHLLDEAAGGYNDAYVQRYFPEGGVALIECVKRTQGLMVAPGNPKGIREFRDIARAGLAYVNRQKGSGTRILCDYLIRQHGMEFGAIEGYAREEFTHTGVAAIVASGGADAGLGIYAAAKIYGLDFIPVCEEQYDLLVKRSVLELAQMQAFLEMLCSGELAARLTAMGGYSLGQPGRIRRVY